MNSSCIEIKHLFSPCPKNKFPYIWSFHIFSRHTLSFPFLPPPHTHSHLPSNIIFVQQYLFISRGYSFPILNPFSIRRVSHSHLYSYFYANYPFRFYDIASFSFLAAVPTIAPKTIYLIGCFPVCVYYKLSLPAHDPNAFPVADFDYDRIKQPVDMYTNRLI